MTDQARQPDGAAVDERHAPTPAVDAERRVGSSDPQVAPDGELEATRHGVTFDRGDHRLAEIHSCRTHRTVEVDVGLDAVARARRHGLEVGARTEGAAGAGEDGNGERGVVVEGAERVDELVGGRPVDGVADIGAVDRDDHHGTIDRNRDGFAHGAVSASGPPDARARHSAR